MSRVVGQPNSEHRKLIDEVAAARQRMECAKADYERALLDAAEAEVNLTQLQRYVGISKQALSRQIKRLEGKTCE